MDNQYKSVSIEVGPQDKRCRYWAIILRAAQQFDVLPADVAGASDLDLAYARRGDEELFEGDIIFEGEEMHHRKMRGWRYDIGVARDGEIKYIAVNAEAKAVLKAAGLDKKYLPGAGDVAAMARIAHGIRAGLI